MRLQIDFSKCILAPLTQNTAAEISQWEYPPPYDSYSIKGLDDQYLMDTSTWGTEQFCLLYNSSILGQVSCQMDNDCLWVGWSMEPQLCGNGYGVHFVKTCITMLRAYTHYSGRIVLRVAAWNRRAIKAYEKAGFHYLETIQDEIAYSNHMEDFWVMELI